MKLSTTEVGLKLFTCALVIGLIVLSVPLSAQDKEVAFDEKAAKILDRFVDVTGGVEKYDAISNRFMKSTFELVGMGVSLDMQFWAAKPTKVYSLIDSPELGTIERGYDGEVFWEKTLMGGPRLLEGNELEDALQEAIMDRMAHWRDHYQKAAYAGEDSVDGLLCDKVVLTLESGKEETHYFDRDEGLERRTDSKIESQMGVIPLSVFIEDYRDFEGIKTAFKSIIKVMGQERLITIDSLAQNVEMPDSLFLLPDDIKELIAAQDTTGGE